MWDSNRRLKDRGHSVARLLCCEKVYSVDNVNLT